MNWGTFADHQRTETWHAGPMHTRPRSVLGRVAISVAGATLIAVGTVGLFLPVLPGVVLIGSGLAVLGRQYGWARTTLERVTPARLKRQRQPDSEAEAA